MATRLSTEMRQPFVCFLKHFPLNFASNTHRSLSSCKVSSILSNKLWSAQFAAQTSGNQYQSSQLLCPSDSCCLIPSRNYGRKVKPKPQKITFFEYSGDLRTLPEIDEEELLYPYLDHKEEIENDEVVKKLASIEFASKVAKNKHMNQLIQDRIIELFGPDSELEQRIASFTLRIRQMIPYCIENRTDKLQKIWLLKAIFHRRRLLTRLRDLDYERFEWLLRELKIRFVTPQDREEWMGWKYNLREATKDNNLHLQRKKLEEFKAKLASEKEAFIQHKAKVLEQIDKDLENFGLTRDFLEDALKKEFQKQPNKPLTLEEKVKLGMTDKIKEYYG